MATKLILIRHGSTAWNMRGRYCGHKDISLSAQGKTEARQIRNALIKEKVTQVYSSDRKRAIQTCRIIFGGSPTQKIPALREINFGVFEGLTYAQIMQKYPCAYARWRKDPFGADIPGGEKMIDFKKRVSKVFRAILSLNKNKTVAVVCHGGTISVFINSLFKKKAFWSYIPKPASLTAVTFKNGRPRIERFSAVS